MLKPYLAVLILGLVVFLPACGANPQAAAEPLPRPVVEAAVEKMEEIDQAPAEIVEAPAVDEAVEVVENEAAAPAIEVTEPDMVKDPAIEAAAPVEITADEGQAAGAETMAEVQTVEEEVMVDEKTVVENQGPTPEQQQLLAKLDILGRPPELFNEVWLNSEPLKLADLKGKVVLVEFWTFGCINCKNVIPSLREWHDEYADDGLVIIGVHTPEFDYERDLTNIENALVDLDVRYPVAVDNDWTTWRSYKQPFGQRFWPTKYFIDKAGNVRHIHIGEGRYGEQEEIIKALLAEGV